MDNEKAALNRGYLNEEFRLYHLRDDKTQEIEYHYHEFDKIVIFISGKVSYIIEGKTYYLMPWDVLLIRHGSIHRPIIERSEMYERIVIWMNKDFLDAHGYEGCELSSCFEATKERQHCLLRPAPEERLILRRQLEELEAAIGSREFGSELMARTHFLQLMVRFNRFFLKAQPHIDSSAFDIDPKVDEMLRYIGENLGGDLSIEALSKRFYISRYHFMRRFKDVTGFTVHSYVLQKRLCAASELLIGGISASQAASIVGFSDYSTFLRSFKHMFELTPKQFVQRKGTPWHSLRTEQTGQIT